MNHDRTISALVEAVEALLDYAGRGAPRRPPGELCRQLRDTLILARNWDEDNRRTAALSASPATENAPNACAEPYCPNTRDPLGYGYCRSHAIQRSAYRRAHPDARRCERTNCQDFAGSNNRFCPVHTKTEDRKKKLDLTPAEDLTVIRGGLP